ncbi:MAG: S8 family serine peptidase [Anaerolineales bacterium]|nr:S8 family serine peptidase [Anaerolineales bacterium]MCB8954719.1 S8 family serine peptidase [Ardenticatenales bacterium]
MSTKRLSFVVLLLLMVGIAGIFATRTTPATAANWESKVSSTVLQEVANGQTEFLVFLQEQADLSGAAQLSTKLEKGTYVYQELTRVAQATQGPILAALDGLGVNYRPYWVANMIWVRGGADVVQALASRDDVAHIYSNPSVFGGVEPMEGLQNAPQGIEWNISLVGAPDVWAAGDTGQGAVIAGQDTGYDWDHPALINQYRGYNGGGADHNYSWHDAIHVNNPNTPPGNPCGFDSPVPCDDVNHGTHTMGTMVGDDGGSNQIGMAPGARWIGCRNMEEGWGMPSTYSECFEWFIAPTDLSGQNPDPAMAPDVISNSWSCPTTEGCTDPNVMLQVVENVRAAGIFIAVSAGNSGSGCSSVNTPAAIYDASFTVGATTSSDVIASYSSRGPVTVDGSNRLKPDISAPGSSVRSSIPGGGYATFSGTSMASPHVAGLVGLLVSANPTLHGQVDQLEAIITDTALHLTTTQNCGGVPGDQIPNNTYGYGRINALAAYQAVAPVMQLSYHFYWSNGSQSMRDISFFQGGRFADSTGAQGAWGYQAANHRLILSYDPGASCTALAVGNFTGPSGAQGWAVCRDGSGVYGVWQAQFLAGALPESAPLALNR